MSDWEEMLASDGRLYYYNRKTGESSWKDPKLDLESVPWRKLKDQEGQTYYYNKLTKEVTWDRPAGYDDKIERQQEIAFKRKNFFRMMSSSIPKDLQLKQNPTPSPFTIKDTSARFDTDPRLICVSEKERERFIDDWLLLERKRRAYLEQKQVKEAMERLKQKMFEMIEAGTFTVDTKWEDVINAFRMNKDWRLLLNFDRLKVFKEVKQCVHAEFMSVAELKREQQMKIEQERRDAFRQALEKLVLERPLSELQYDTLRDEIEGLCEYKDLQKNTSGATAGDIFYDVVELRTASLDALAESIRDELILTIAALGEHDRVRDRGLSLQEMQYLFNIYKYKHALRVRALLECLRGCESLLARPPFEEAITIIRGISDFQAVSNETAREVYDMLFSTLTT